jgi:hypothetical protein
MPVHIERQGVSCKIICWYNQRMIVLNEKEEQLVKTVRVLPKEAADQILLWASQLANVAAGRPVEWSDHWTEEDMRDATAASLRSFDESEPETS